MQNRLFAASLLLLGHATGHAQLAFQGPPIALHAGAGAVTFTLSNRGSTAVEGIKLTHGPIVDSATHSVIDGAAVTLTTDGKNTNLPTMIAPGATLSLEANLTGISGTSQAEFSVLNDTLPLGTLGAFDSTPPLTITIDGDGSAPDKPLAYTRRNPVVIAVKNSDSESYHIHWIFQVSNQEEHSNDIYMGPSGSSRIMFTPTTRPFSILDWIHPSNKNGVLLLSVIPLANVHDGLLPTRSLPVSLVMQPFSSFWSAFWSYSYVAFLLLIGGLLSFLASSMLPNMQRKGVLRAQLQDLANRTTTVSTRIDSYLRVLLRLERSRIKNLIDNAPAWIPASADPLVQAAASIDNLGKRLAAAERLDNMRRRLDQVSATAPPYVTDGIDANLQAAADQLHSIAISDTVMATVNGYFDKAQAGLDLLDNTDALAKQVAGNVTLVMTRIVKFAHYYADLKDSLPDVFIVADPTRGYNDPTNLVRPMLFAIDHAAAAVQLALDYAVVRASIPVTQPAQAQIPATAAHVPTAPAATTVPPTDGGAPVVTTDGPQTAAANTAVPRTPVLSAASPPADSNQTSPANVAAPQAQATNATLMIPSSATVAAFVNAAPAKPFADAPPVPSADSNTRAPSASAIQQGPEKIAAQATPALAVDSQAADTTLLPPANATLRCDDFWETPRQRLRKRHCLLLELLGKLSWNDLRDASLLVQEMREDTYEEDILSEISKQGQAEICFDTQRARPLQPVFFSVRFNNSRFNNAAALQRLIWHWTFPDGLDEYTSKVCHYFSGYEHETVPPSEPGQARTATGSMTVGSNLQKNRPHKRPHNFSFSTPTIKRDLDVYVTIRGQQVGEAREVPVPPLRKTIHIQSYPTTERSRFWAEILQFAIAFGVALAGLLSGALEQLQKLDVIPASLAIIGLGFTASAIKNLLTQSAAPQMPVSVSTPATAQK
jgi:hypothetical protein